MVELLYCRASRRASGRQDWEASTTTHMIWGYVATCMRCLGPMQAAGVCRTEQRLSGRASAILQVGIFWTQSSHCSNNDSCSDCTDWSLPCKDASCPHRRTCPALCDPVSGLEIQCRAPCHRFRKHTVMICTRTWRLDLVGWLQ